MMRISGYVELQDYSYLYRHQMTIEVDVLEWGWDSEAVNNYWIKFTVNGEEHKIDWGPGSRSIGRALTLEFFDGLGTLIPLKWIESW
jgi:hypothetical protein